MFFNVPKTQRKAYHMARLVISLNDTKIKNAKAQEKDYTLTDGQGLQLLVKTTGVKLWEFRYNSPIKNKRRKTSFGKYPIVKLADARLKRDEYLELISKEIDPIDHFRVLKEEQKKEDEKNTHTVQYIIDLFYEFKKNNGLAESTLKKDKKRVTTHFIDKIGANKNIHEISFKEVIDVLKPLEDENKIETLSRVKNILVNAFKYAYGQDILEDTELFGRLELFKFKKQFYQ
jgi:hypothetical protein